MSTWDGPVGFVYSKPHEGTLGRCTIAWFATRNGKQFGDWIEMPDYPTLDDMERGIAQLRAMEQAASNS